MLQGRPVVTPDPENSETPLEELRSWVTPNAYFFVRNHFAEPELDPRSWRLVVHGRVREARTWTWETLQELPERTVFATMECAGNGRSFLRPPSPGVQWGAGAVGHAEWTGVPLAELLERAGVEPGAVEVLCEGADRGTEPDHPEPMRFQRGLPLEKALHRDTLLALRMNGEPLTRSHGAPVRLLVPGWYGVCSVKWLVRLEILDRPFAGYYQARKYTIRRAETPHPVPVTRMVVKSEIIRPVPGAELPPGTHRVTGLAWAGEEAVAGVEVSSDRGRTWHPAELVGPQAPYSWTLWEWLWKVSDPGEYLLTSRAISTTGETQPQEHDPLRGGYLIHALRPRPVTVTAGDPARESWGDAASLLYDMAQQTEAWSQARLDVELEFADGAGI